MRKIFFISFAFCITILCSSCKKDNDKMKSTVEVNIVNVGFTSWKVVSVLNSSNFATIDVNNTPFTFEKGRRYKIINTANIAVHPFEFRNSANNVMLSQNPMNMGNLASDASINFVAEGNSISFTVSNNFQMNVATYNCANHNGMRGNVLFQ